MLVRGRREGTGERPSANGETGHDTATYTEGPNHARPPVARAKAKREEEEEDDDSSPDDDLPSVIVRRRVEEFP